MPARARKRPDKPPLPSPIDPRLRFLVSGGMFAGLALTSKLWLSGRLYPQTPVLPFSGRLPEPIDITFYLGMLALLVIIPFMSRPAKAIGGFVAIAVFLAL